jgi:hypothetical protein
VSELAVAAFAAETDAHLLDAPRTARFKSFCARFDEGAYLSTLAAAGLRWIARRDPTFPGPLRAIHDRACAALPGSTCSCVRRWRSSAPARASLRHRVATSRRGSGEASRCEGWRGASTQPRGALKQAIRSRARLWRRRDYPRPRARSANHGDGADPLGYPPASSRAAALPARNRIVETRANVVVEAREPGGAHHRRRARRRPGGLVPASRRT